MIRTKGARTNLLAQPVLSTYAEVKAVRGRIGHRYVDCMRWVLKDEEDEYMPQRGCVGRWVAKRRS